MQVYVKAKLLWQSCLQFVSKGNKVAIITKQHRNRTQESYLGLGKRKKKKKGKGKRDAVNRLSVLLDQICRVMNQ